MLPPLPPTFDAALRDVTSSKWSARLAAAERLGHGPASRTDEATQALLPLLCDRHPRVREATLASLSQLPRVDPEMDELTLEGILTTIEDAAPNVREAAVIATASIGGPRAAEALTEALQSPHPEVRFQATMGLAELVGQDAASTLMPLLHDDDAEVRMHAATALRLTHDRMAADPLAIALDDPSEAVRIEAALTLATLGDRRGANRLREALRHREYAVDAALALGDLGATEATDDLARLAKARWFRSPLVRAAASASLARWGDDRGVTSLRGLLRSTRPETRAFTQELVDRYEIRLGVTANA